MNLTGILAAILSACKPGDDSIAWSLSSHDYLSNAIKQVQTELTRKDLSLKELGTGLRPYPATYRPEIDVTPTLDEEGTNRFQQLIYGF